jgi:arabinose-5-phosphate isomerase
MSPVVLDTARQVLKIEAQTLKRMIQRLDHRFTKAIDMMFRCKGRIILTGMGKPGFIARKIAATLASTGTPSFYLHPAEATHGDLGMVQETDLVIAISNSGETEEIVRLLSSLKKIGVPLIALTSNKKSTLALRADVVLELGVTREACPLNLAPSASTTAALAMGDALALSLHQRKGFRPEDFAMLHPGGSLGRQLLTVKDIMRKGRDNPLISEDMPVRDALIKITGARAGSCTITDKRGKIRGIFTDGDFRRHVRRNGERILDEPVKKFATFHPMTIRQDQMAAEAVHLLKTKKIDELPVVDEKGRAVGLLDVQDLLKAGFV